MTILGRCGRGLLTGTAMVAALMTAMPVLPAAAATSAADAATPVGLPGGATKDIIFIILDDVGIDQLGLFGYGGRTPPKMPNLAKIAEQGVRFSNAWAMPQCSPSRATFFTGRYPLRTGVTNAIVDNHIPQTYLSSFEATLPRLLSDVGYKSAMVGKYHLGDENDPAGTCAPSTRGFDAFIGNLTPGPPSTDYTAGGVDPTGSQTCGFFQTTQNGACYSLGANNRISCEYIREKNARPQTTPSETCLQTGGIFTPGERCGADKPEKSAFSVDNAYYVWPQVTLNRARSPYAAPQCTDQETIRKYMTTVQSDNAVDWWTTTKGKKMLTVSYNSMHTPLQPAPNQLVRGGMQDPYNCLAAVSPRGLINGMLESADVEIGRFLEGIGRAKLSKNRKTIETLDLTGIALVLVGDNGSFGPTVRTESDFSLTRAKGFVYETGVRVPLIISGDFVVEPNRDVDAMVNIADLFHLFGAFANVNVNQAVPATTILDSKPLLPYVRRPDQAPIRKTNYAELGPGVFTPDPEERSWPCYIGNSCNDVLFPTESLCVNNNGTWYGPGAPVQQTSCCAVIDPSQGQTIFPVNQAAVRDANFKLVEMQNTNCAAPLQEGDTPAFPWAEYNLATTYELYNVKVTKTNPTGLDKANANLAADCGSDPSECLSDKNLARFQALYAELESIRASADPQNACTAIGDGNMDMKVDDLDVAGWTSFQDKGPSRYDINVDGLTNDADLQIINDNLGTDCTAEAGRVLKRAAALR
ncbi:sulfatase-like hydrolase/transferase [Pseudoxanthobacter sp. M-2]|uniref:sulfatase-like hydrolase/transferase n=1 Tax=Pseudoxanthobacter sp. M-2 TaxID=3078754 RepID=UPI0038FC9EC0